MIFSYLAIAAVPNPTLQDTVISQLVKINALQSKWLLLAEIGLPNQFSQLENL